MYHSTNLEILESTRPTPLDELGVLADQRWDPILDAAALLGGNAGVRLAHPVLDGLATAGTPSRRTMRVLDELLDLLTLEHVHDLCRPEAANFAAIDPASAAAEEICLLAGELTDARNIYRNYAVSQPEAGRAAA